MGKITGFMEFERVEEGSLVVRQEEDVSLALTPEGDPSFALPLPRADDVMGGVVEEDVADLLARALESGHKTFKMAIPKLLGMSGTVKFNLEDNKRTELKGNIASMILSKKDLFGDDWWGFDEAKQDVIVWQLVKEENEAKLIAWLQNETGIDEARAEKLANVALPEGYGSLSAEALARILPELQREVITYDKAVIAAGFDHHSNISASAPGVILQLNISPQSLIIK